MRRRVDCVKDMRRLLLAAALLCAGLAQAFSGTVTRVADGDTLWVRPVDTERKPMKVRLLGIDAPERCQPGGREATQALEARLLHRRVEVQASAQDDYGRALGRVFDEDGDVNAWMVEQGHAWSPHWHRRRGVYAREEDLARAAGRGLHADPQALEPRLFRRLHGPCEPAWGAASGIRGR